MRKNNLQYANGKAAICELFFCESQSFFRIYQIPRYAEVFITFVFNNVFCAIKKRRTDASVTEKIIVEYIKLRNMKSLLIKDTTISERAQIVREALGAESDCEGIDLSDMYDDYIYGFKEIAEINLEFSEKHAGTVVAGKMSRPSGCGFNR